MTTSQENPVDLAVTGLTIGLAAHRITRLIVLDTVWGGTRAHLRSWLKAKGEPAGYVLDTVSGQSVFRYEPRQMLPGKAAEALGCAHCAGVWVTAATAAAWHYGGPKTRSAIRLAALAGIQSLLVKPK